MKIFNVVRKSDNKIIYTYSSDIPIEWDSMGFSECDHIEQIELNEIPVQQEIYQQPIRITKLAFRNRFTPSEKVKLELASKDDTSADIEVRKQSAAIKVYLDDVNSATFIDLSRSDTRNGVLLLESYGLIGIGRALEILDTPPTEQEKFNGS